MQFACNKMDYFIGEIVAREAMSIRLSKYIAVFDYVDKALLVLSATSGVVSIASFATFIGTAVRIASVSLGSVLLSVMELKKKLKLREKKKKQQNCFYCRKLAK